MNWKNLKHLIKVILDVKYIFRCKIILKMIVYKTIYYFSESTNVFKELLVLAMVNKFLFGNLKFCLMKVLIPLLDLIIVLLILVLR